MHPAELQLHTLRLYGELVSRHETLASRLVFTCGEQSSASGLPAAVSIAGGTSLCLDPDAAAVKSVFRQGGLDFVVNSLDEAVRVLKNEIRKHTPLSVALIAPAAAVLAEITERGLQPDLQVQLSPCHVPPHFAVEQLELTTADGMVQPSPHAAAWLAGRHWSEHALPAATTAELRALDVRLVSLVQDSVRQQWLRRIPHYQRPVPNAGRALWLTAEEAAQVANLSLAAL